MSIRLLAQEFYRSQQEADQLKKQLDSASWKDKARLEADFRRACAERDRLRRMLDGHIGRSN